MEIEVEEIGIGIEIKIGVEIKIEIKEETGVEMVQN
jgi:hypothetical protein